MGVLQVLQSAILTSMSRIALATKEFSEALPKQHEIVRGMLVRKAMPTFEHGDLQRELGTKLRSFEVRRGGRWWLASECEVELAPGERYLPDLAGWDNARVSERPTGARVRTPPQWVCEILSPSTAKRDLSDKKSTYHAVHVDYYWLIDPETKMLTVLGWADDDYRTLLEARGGEVAHAAPFEAIELDLGELFG